MPDQRTSRFCQHCNKQVLAIRSRPSESMGILLIVLTCGLWLIVLLCQAIASLLFGYGGWRCSECGRKV